MVFRLHFAPNYLKCDKNVDISTVWEAGALMVNHRSFRHLSQVVYGQDKSRLLYILFIHYACKAFKLYFL
jgi:hypothetical protein